MFTSHITPFEPENSARSLHLAGPNVWQDLKTFIGRARRVDGGGAVHLNAPAQRPVLAAWVSIMDGVAGTVLGMRTFQLARPGDVDVTVYLAGVADRLAREINLLNSELGVPPVSAQTRWAAELPPVSGWEPVGTLDAQEVIDTARTGAKELAELAPEVPGMPIIAALRNRIWFTPMLPGVPSGAAFALEVLGFVHAVDEVEVYRSGEWYRLSTPTGHVLARMSPA